MPFDARDREVKARDAKTWTMGPVERLSIVVPTYNERANLPQLVEAIDRHAPRPYRIVVVDDGSPDGTAEIARGLAREHPVRVVSRRSRDGLGSAYRVGFGVARGDAIVQMDADLSHDPQAIPSLVAAVEDGAGIALGSRYLEEGSADGWSLRRRAISHTANMLARGVLGLEVKDATSGYRCIEADHTDLVRETVEDGFAFQVETLARARARDIPVREVAIRFRPRAHGRSKLHTREVAAFASAVTRLAAGSA